MKRLLQEEWLGINFSQLGLKLSFFKRPSSVFYSTFYNTLFSKYNSYEDLPSIWCQEKSNIANEIAKIISEESLVLSYGCGIGFIEKELVSQISNLSIDAFDFSESYKWLRDVDRVNTIQSIEKNKKYNFIYSTQVLFAMSNDEIFEFSSIVKERLSRGGLFLTIDRSLNTIENGIEASNKIKSIKFQLKNIVFPFWYWYLMRRKTGQFWGWERDNDELSRIFKSNGFRVVRNFSSCEQSFLIFEVS